MSDTLKILYVDDEKINRFVFDKLMSRKYHVITAEDGPSALKIIEEHHDFEYIVSDMRMPVMNGLEFITRVKEKRPAMKCYILTGYSINEDIEAALNSGLILDYWTKPADFEMIDKVLQDSY